MLRCENLLKEIGKNISKIRKAKNISQEKLAEKVELHRNQIGRIERGEINVPIYTLYKIAEKLGVSSSDILPF